MEPLITDVWGFDLSAGEREAAVFQCRDMIERELQVMVTTYPEVIYFRAKIKPV